MPKRKREEEDCMPEKVFIGATGKHHRHAFIRIVLAVDSWDEDHVPVRFTRMRSHEEAAERGNSDFMIAYVPESMMVVES